MAEDMLEYELDGLTAGMRERARAELMEEEEITAAKLEELRSLVRMEKNLVIPTDDAFLLPYLRARKFHTNRAFKLLQNYWHFVSKNRRIYGNSDPDRVKEVLLRNFLTHLPYRDRNGCTLIVFNVGDWDPALDTTVPLMFQAISALLQHTLFMEATQVCGYRVIFDLRTLSWRQLRECTPANLLLLISATQMP